MMKPKQPPIADFLANSTAKLSAKKIKRPNQALSHTMKVKEERLAKEAKAREQGSTYYSKKPNQLYVSGRNKKQLDKETKEGKYVSF